MRTNEKIVELKNIIFSNLKNIISDKVAIFGLPTHGNIGDTLIALGELEFLKEIGAKCIYTRLLLEDNPNLPKLPEDCTIIFQGGGDFGDIWRGIHENRLNIIKNYPYHNIIIFPQSVYYNNQEFLKYDASVLSKYSNLTICARDEVSYKILNNNFKNKILLIPDMAFYIPLEKIHKYTKPASKFHLFLSRVDKEKNIYKDIDISKADISDWPTINNNDIYITTTFKFIGIMAAFRIRRLYYIEKLIHQLTIYYVKCWLYPHIMKIGIEFISKYRYLTLTRLHAAILSILLDKKFTLLDNSYSKNKNFHKKWLSNVDSINFVE